MLGEFIMNIAITGSSGLIGFALLPFLRKNSHNVSKILRSYKENDKINISWLPESDSWSTAYKNGLDGVVHLAGENIAAGKWTVEKKDGIRKSRVYGTKSLCESICNLSEKPKVLICASAIGFYGDRGDEVLNEESTKGTGFLSDVCQDWEDATKIASQSGIRVVNLRFGMVLSSNGGALAKMLLPFKLGVGGKIGSGKQYMSWIAIDDVVGAINHALVTDSLAGAVNTVSPNVVTNKTFTKILGSVLGRPTLLPMPAFGARLAFGEMANELLLSSSRVEPDKLLKAGYKFKYPDLKTALNHLLRH